MSAKSSESYCPSNWLSRASLYFGCVAAFLASSAAASEPQILRQWYPNGGLKTERQVTTDSVGNIINHSTWREWDADGKLIAEGRYDLGQRVGPWTIWFNRAQADVLHTTPFDRFAAPFESRANFVDGQMDGEWIIADAHGRMCSRVTLEHGQRSGPATMWLPDGRIFREASFLYGRPTGDLRELDNDGELKSIATYGDGYQLVNKVTSFHDSELKHIEATCVAGVVTQLALDDYTRLRFAKYAVRERFARHGPWRSWYSNGQLQCEGTYQLDRENGTFTWWHANGTQAAKGCLVDGKPDGAWTWWHPSGQQAATDQFTGGEVGFDAATGKQSRQKRSFGSFATMGLNAVTRKNPQLY